MKKENKSERVMVHVRMRPFSEEELKQDNTTPIENFDTINNTISIKKDFDKKTFSYDTVLNMNIKQKDVFEKTAKEVVDSVIKGYNGTIFAYGQTGTGKTHTMVGNFEDEANKGIIPRTFLHLFDSIKGDKDYSYTISISFIQIYLESIQDLLEPSNENIRIREDPENGVYLEGVEWITVRSPEDCRLVFLAGEKNRTVASTKMNAHSSRSHAIMIVKVEKGILISPEKIKEIANISQDALKNDRPMTKSMLFLVDLAGSERVKKTGADAVRLNEAKKINFSLLVLGNCIKSLSDAKGGHVSYRDSKLTRLLQESLGGNAKTSLIVTISPSSYNTDETVSSLGFGLRAMKVQNKPQVNKSVDYQALCIKLQEDLDRLNDDYSKVKIENDKLLAENNSIKNGEVFVEMQRKSICNLDASKLESIIKAASPDANKKQSPLQADLNKSLSNSPMSSLDKDSIKNYKEELNKLEAFYEQMIKKKDLEYEKILIQVDNELSEKENENEELKSKNSEITNKYNILVDLLKDYEAEKEDSQKSIIELTNKLEENKKSSEKFVSQVKKMQAIKPEDQSILSQLGKNLNSNNNIISDILSKELRVDNTKNENENFICENCKMYSLNVNNQSLSSESVQQEIKSTNSNKLGFIDSNNFTNKFIEILRDNDFDLERFRENPQDKTYKIKILDLENIMVSIIEEKKELKNKTTEIQKILTTRDSKLKDLIEKDQKACNLIEDLRKEKLSLQNKINELNEISLLKENLSIEKLDKQESYYKLESQKKDFESIELKSFLADYLKKINELEDLNLDLKTEIEKKNDVLFELKNKSIDKNQLQVYYSELHKNADNFISEKQKILDKNILLFKEVEESISRIKTDLKDSKTIYEKAENLKRNFNAIINASSLETLNINDPSRNIFKNFQNNSSYICEIEKLIEDFEENFSKIEDEAVANFLIKNVSLLPKSSTKSNASSHSRNKSVFINNQKNSIICRVENLNTTTNSNNNSNNNHNNNKAYLSSDSNTLTTDENVSNFDSTGTNKIKATENTRSNVDFEGFNCVFNCFIENIESINMDYLEIINALIHSQKFVLGILKLHKKILSQQTHDFSSLRLEIDLTKKNENFLKNSIIYLQQCSVENFFSVIPKEEAEEILNSLNYLSSSICNMDAPDVIKFSSNILNETNLKINNFLSEKNLIIENLNEKINYLNKEIDLLKKPEKPEAKQEPQDKKDKAASAQLHKLQAQLKLKEEEISRLNERIEEHLKTINKLSKEQTQIQNKNSSSYEILTPEKKSSSGSASDKLGFEFDKAAQEIGIMGAGVPASAKRASILNPGINVTFMPGIANNNADFSMSASPKIRRESSILEFKNNINSFEDEIKELRLQINEQKNTYETQIYKKEISYKELERIHDIESTKKTQKDANTGRYLIKDYLLRTQNFVDELFRFLNPSD